VKDFLKELVAEQRTPLLKHSVAREYLQARILGVLQEHGAFLNWVFLGGTALRFLFRIPRYSEDLDFAVLDRAKPHGFRRIVERIRATFEAEGYRVTVKSAPDKTVACCFVRFGGLPHELGLTPHRKSIISFKRKKIQWCKMDQKSRWNICSRTGLMRYRCASLLFKMECFPNTRC
jgi:hypothetical protein